MASPLQPGEPLPYFKKLGGTLFARLARYSRLCSPCRCAAPPQAGAYRALLSPARHIILADHAGSGKTLAYLLPLVQQLKEAEAAAGRPAPHRPRVVVVVPTAGERARCQGGRRVGSAGCCLPAAACLP